ncbi:MAG: type II toxin-antitoxin system HicB family antitoxin [Planctomycetota bacterium]
MKEHKDFKIIIEKDCCGNYIASAPELNNCRAQGKSMEEVQAQIKKAIKCALGVTEASIELENLTDTKNLS